MSALWPMGEGTVRDIHRQLAMARPRAYTTVLTIMDRLAQKGIVTRCKVGRAYRYHANLSADEARLKAVDRIVAGFFDGSADALAAHLAGRVAAIPSASSPLRALIDPRDTLDKESIPRTLDESLL